MCTWLLSHLTRIAGDLNSRPLCMQTKRRLMWTGVNANFHIFLKVDFLTDPLEFMSGLGSQFICLTRSLDMHIAELILRSFREEITVEGTHLRFRSVRRRVSTASCLRRVKDLRRNQPSDYSLFMYQQ